MLRARKSCRPSLSTPHVPVLALWQGSKKVPRQNEAQDLWHGSKTARTHGHGDHGERERERNFDPAEERMLEQVLLLSGGYCKRSIMYQLSVHCVDGTTELDITFEQTDERPEQSENKNKKCRVCRMLASQRTTVLGRLWTTDVTVAFTVRKDKDKQEKIRVLTLSGCVEKRLPPTKKGRSQRTEDRRHTLFLCSDLEHRYMMI